MSLRQSERIHVRSQTKGKENGYMTVFLAMSMTIILSLILTLFAGARIGAVKMKTECIMDIGMNSVLAEYSRALYEQYGLLMVDTSYGTGRHTIVNTEEHLEHYIQKNCDRGTVGGLLGYQTILSMSCEEAKINGSSFAMDNNGAVLNRQILAYMGSQSVGTTVDEAMETAETIKREGFDTRDIEAEAAEVQAEIDAFEPSTFINDEGEEEQVSLPNPADAIRVHLREGILNLAIGDKDKISKAVINPDEYVSHREQNHGTGLSDQQEISVMEKALLNSYYFIKCSRYGNELEKSALKYQLEYLVYGQESDWANLERFTEFLFFVREVANATYLFSCEAKKAEVKNYVDAILLPLSIFIPEIESLSGPLTASLLFAWTLAESVKDVNILLDGGRVPLIKSDSTWQLGFFEMFIFTNLLNGGDCGEGLSYEGYLMARVLMVDIQEKTQRLADIIEMDIRKTAGNAEFMIDHCLDVFRAEVTIATEYGYDCKIERVYGYEE